MEPKIPRRDPIAAHQRKAKATRRVGPTAKCKCGEARPQALVPGTDPTVCAECQRRQAGQTTNDQHHPFGQANSSVTVPVPVNDHRADLSEAQQDWPKRTRENPDGSPALRAAATIRGFVDTIVYLIKTGLLWVAETLERLDELLVERVGREWWTTIGLA